MPTKKKNVVLISRLRVREFYLLITFTLPANPLKIHGKTSNPTTLPSLEMKKKLFFSPKVIAYVKLYLRNRMFSLRPGIPKIKVEQTFMNFKSDDGSGCGPIYLFTCVTNADKNSYIRKEKKRQRTIFNITSSPPLTTLRWVTSKAALRIRWRFRKCR